MLVQLYYYLNRRFLKNKLIISYEKIVKILNFIYSIFLNYFSCVLLKSNHFFLILKNNKFLNFLSFLKNSFSLNFSQLMDLIIIDKLEMNLIKGKRFNFIYVLLSLLHNLRIYISGFLGLFEVLTSTIMLFSSAD
jgi:NADH:ubiquinone oxidoreductase subunit C